MTMLLLAAKLCRVLLVYVMCVVSDDSTLLSIGIPLHQLSIILLLIINFVFFKFRSQHQPCAPILASIGRIVAIILD